MKEVITDIFSVQGNSSRALKCYWCGATGACRLFDFGTAIPVSGVDCPNIRYNVGTCSCKSLESLFDMYVSRESSFMYLLLNLDVYLLLEHSFYLLLSRYFIMVLWYILCLGFEGVGAGGWGWLV